MSTEPDAVPAETRRTFTLALRWQGVTDLPTVYANELAILHTANEFYLVFGEVMLPAVPSDEQMIDVPIRTVARVAVSPRQMLRFAEVIQQNVERFIAHSQEEEDA